MQVSLQIAASGREDQGSDRGAEVCSKFNLPIFTVCISKDQGLFIPLYLLQSLYVIYLLPALFILA